MANGDRHYRDSSLSADKQKHPKRTLPKVNKAAVVDELGLLELELEAAAKLAKVRATKLQIKELRAEELRAEILSWHAEDDALHEAVEHGRSFEALVSKQEIRRQIVTPKPDLFRMLGRDKFFAIYEASLAELRKALTKEQFAAAVREERTGPRTVEVVAKERLTEAA